MQRYVGWQNGVRGPDELRRARFIEIPALHQTGLFRRDAVLRVTGGAYLDDPRYPVDMAFWMLWFGAADPPLACAKARADRFGLRFWG